MSPPDVRSDAWSCLCVSSAFNLHCNQNLGAVPALTQVIQLLFEFILLFFSYCYWAAFGQWDRTLEESISKPQLTSMLLWLDAALCCTAQASQWLLFSLIKQINVAKVKCFLCCGFKQFKAFSQWYCFLLSPYYLTCFFPLATGVWSCYRSWCSG